MKSADAANFAHIKVLVETTYVIPLAPDAARDQHDVHLGPVDPNTLRTNINGWTIAETIQNWFRRYSLGSSHATRDSHLVGRKFHSVVSVTVGDVAAPKQKY